jgi:hypothetical protein
MAKVVDRLGEVLFVSRNNRRFPGEKMGMIP